MDERVDRCRNDHIAVVARAIHFPAVTCNDGTPLPAPSPNKKLCRFVSTCEALGLSYREDAMTTLVAEKIIELAQRGIKNPTALQLAAIKEFKSDPQ